MAENNPENKKQDENEDNRGFKVVDRRREGRDEEAASKTPPEPEKKTEPKAESSRVQSEAHSDHAPFSGEDAFVQFIMSLATSVMMHLGLMPGPDGKPMEKNLPLARQSIDILGLLETKTKGNLNAQEEQLLTNILSDLRMRFVEEQNKK